MFVAVVAQVFKKPHIEKSEDSDKENAESKGDNLASTGECLSWIERADHATSCFNGSMVFKLICSRGLVIVVKVAIICNFYHLKLICITLLSLNCLNNVSVERVFKFVGSVPQGDDVKKKDLLVSSLQCISYFSKCQQLSK